MISLRVVATVSLAAKQVRRRHRIMVIRAAGAVLGSQDHLIWVTAGCGRSLDRRPASRLHPAVRMVLPADQLSRVGYVKILTHIAEEARTGSGGDVVRRPGQGQDTPG